MNRKRNLFQQQVENLLKFAGTFFQGIHLTCRRCKQEAFAKDLFIAAGLGGWTDIRRIRGPHYSGLCIDCKKQQKGAQNG